MLAWAINKYGMYEKKSKKNKMFKKIKNMINNLK